MRKKQNVYKPKRNFNIVNNMFTILFSLALVSFFTLIGYSVAKPFAKVGEAEKEKSVSGAETETVPVTETYTAPGENDTVAYWLAEAEIEDMDTLERMLDRIDDSYNTVVIPLKIKGGMLNYNSSNEGAIMAEVTSEPELDDIVSKIKSRGFKPAASLSLLNDNMYPRADKSAGFIDKKSGKLWYDADENKGGKPWLSPSASSSGNYLSSLTAEIAGAGFEFIIAADVEFPQFSRIGLDAIGESVTNENRYLDLIDIVNKTAAAADSNNSEMWIEISAAEMFDGTCEVFQPILLDTEKIVLEINVEDFKSVVKCGDENIDFSSMSAGEKAEKVCDIAETYIYKTSFIPELIGKSLTSSDKREAAEAFKRMDYDSYIIR